MESYPLGFKDLHVQVTRFRGQLLVHIRSIDPETGSFTERGIALTEEEWTHFVSLFPRIDSALQSGDSAKISVGLRDRLVSVEKFRGQCYIDIRAYWRKDGKLQPTRRGAVLNLEGWSVLNHVRYLIDEDLERGRAIIGNEVEFERSRRDELVMRAQLARKRRELQEEAADPIPQNPPPTPTQPRVQRRGLQTRPVKRMRPTSLDLEKSSAFSQYRPEHSGAMGTMSEPAPPTASLRVDPMNRKTSTSLAAAGRVLVRQFGLSRNDTEDDSGIDNNDLYAEDDSQLLINDNESS